MKPQYEFQFKKKRLPFYVDVTAESISQAVDKANSIGGDSVWESDQCPDVTRIVLSPDDWDDMKFTAEDIHYVYGQAEEKNINDTPK